MHRQSYSLEEVGMSELETLCEQIRNCQKCPLSRGRTLAVPGQGPEDAALMFIGEAPGFHEDQQGLPFVGAAGKFLDQLLASINLSRQDVYIANVIKCRPPDNRDPLPAERTACRPYLDKQIELIKPKMIVTLGRFSMQLAFSGVTISQIHGKPKKVGDLVYFPMFHPAAALHQPRFRVLIEQDMLKIPQILANIQSIEAEAEAPPPPEQLTLF
jgi:DNA polymerase